jgi:hypothetical protein
LGGLVVKKVQKPIETSDRKAIIEAYNNPDYASLSRDIAAVVFFGTPHQGSDLAGILNLVLTASFASRNFVKQLRPNSDALEEINNNFRHRVEKLKVVSFFETENTRLQSVHHLTISSFTLLVDPDRENDCSQRVRHSALSKRGHSWVEWESSHHYQVRLKGRPKLSHCHHRITKSYCGD